MADELFGDLLGPKAGSSLVGRSSSVAPVSSTKGVFEGFYVNKPMNGSGEEAHSAGVALGVTEANKTTVNLTAEEFSTLIDKGIHSAMEETFSKFVRSLRTVLEDMTRRIASQEATVLELRAAIGDLREVIESQPADLHMRFANLDMAVKEVERGVQALRDRQELQEAQELLARMSTETSRARAQSTTAPSPPSVAQAAMTPQPAEALAAAPSVPAPAPAPAPVPAVSTAPAVPPAPTAPVPSSVPVPAAVTQAGSQAGSAPGAAPSFPPQQQGPYGLPMHSAIPQQAPVLTHMAPTYPVVGPMGMPGAPPLPMSQQPAMEMPQQPQSQPPQQQQPPMPALQYQYQPQPQVSSIQHQPEPGAYGAMLPPQQQQQSAHAGGYPSPYGAMPGVEAPRAPSMTMPHGMPPPQSPTPPGAPGMPGPGGPNMQMVSYPPPPSGVPAYPPPSSVPGVSVPSMFTRPTAPAPSYRGSAPPALSSGGGGGGPTGSRTVSLDKIITDLTQMGFSRGELLAAVNSLQSSGKALDLNTIIDKLTRG